MHRRHLLAAAAIPALAGLTACGGGDGDPTITDRLSAEADYSTLFAAVSAAGLTSTLSGPGPFTLFAPTNAAFNAVLTELGLTLNALLANTTLLNSVLTTHVLPARVLAASVPNGLAVTTVQGGILKPERPAAGGVTIQDGRNRVARVTATDSLCSNGVIHRIDRVLLPANRNIVETAVASAPEFSILVAAVTAAGLGNALSAPGPLTVFAPTNAAFAALLTELNITQAALLANVPLLTSVLTYHVVSGRVLRAGVPVGTDITTLQTGRFRVDANLVITDARARTSRITATDVLCTNGVIHVIDRVILPPVAA